ncbi:CgeB family protein [Marininema halotolerans]|uniref:Spore maturation protein CgeB n=1 Tax=Marininema halotolerans TaxID=1155944 RepID=A0A1I6RNZ7_9BACL|nr:glycosyltransferase [Marininema halotolerans]SFS66412.1 spore maturation protein CgeB [Marininema halotolerans]
MRLLFISRGIGSLANLNPNMITALRRLERELPSFQLVSLPTFDKKQLDRVVRRQRPDIALVMRGFAVPSSLIHYLREKRIPVGVWLADDPYHLTDSFHIVRPYHFAITQEASCAPVYRSRGKPCYFLPLGVNPSIYRPMTVEKKYESDICLIANAFPARIQIVDQLAPYLKTKRLVLIGKWWDRLRNYGSLQRFVQHTEVPPAEVVRYYNGAKIVLNIHRSCNDIKKNPKNIPAYSPNNRTFDIAACRSFQLVSHRRDLNQFYHVGSDIISYHTPVDLVKKLDFYLDHPEKRRVMAERAFRHTLREHTYDVRVRRLYRILHHYLTTYKRKPKRRVKYRLKKKRKK